MAQTSLPWANNGIGDGQSYDDDEWSDWQRKAFTADRTLQGPIFGYANKLEVLNPSGYTLRVSTGAAWVDGKFYDWDVNIDFTTTDDGTAIGAPGLGTNYYTVVLRKDWAAQTVRAAVLNVSTVAYPTVTQTDGTTWEIALAYFSVTSGGVKTLTDARNFSSCNGPKVTNRQGGSATDWYAGGATNYKIDTSPQIQCGSAEITNTNSSIVVVFPIAFSAVPVVVLTHEQISGSAGYAQITALTKTQMQIERSHSSNTSYIHWIAIGPV